MWKVNEEEVENMNINSDWNRTIHLIFQIEMQNIWNLNWKKRSIYYYIVRHWTWTLHTNTYKQTNQKKLLWKIELHFINGFCWKLRISHTENTILNAIISCFSDTISITLFLIWTCSCFFVIGFVHLITTKWKKKIKLKYGILLHQISITGTNMIIK